MLRPQPQFESPSAAQGSLFQLIGEKCGLELRVPHKLIHSNKIDWFIAEQYSSQCNILEALEPT